MSKVLQRACTAITLAIAVTPAAHAALGGDVASVLHDHGMIRAADVVTTSVQYDVHEARGAAGIHIRQYVDRSSGKVFAVTWDGPHSPDVSGLLGPAAARYTAAARAHRGSHHVLSINDPDLSVTVMRLPRGWRGQAYLPAAIPAGVDRAELR